MSNIYNEDLIPRVSILFSKKHSGGSNAILCRSSFHNRVEEPLVHLLLTIHNGVCDVAKWAVGHKGVLNPQ